MTQEHPITPPPELVKQWLTEFYGPESMPWMAPGEMVLHVAAVAARWGADQELEACCKWVSQFDYDDYSYGDRLRAARRHPKPPSLKEQALQELDLLTADATTHGLGFDASAIRRALELLDD